MKVEVKKLPKSEVELKITVPYETYQEQERKAVKELGKEIKVDGFREGHVPEDVIRERVGQDGIRRATLELLLPQTYAAAVKEHNLQVIAPPKVDIKSPVQKAGDELIYVATVAVMPEVKVGNYKKIKVERKKAEVTPKQVEETLEMILNRFAEWKDVKRKAQKGDRVEVDFEGFDPAGKPAPNTKSVNHPIILGSNTMVPGFEDAIEGLSPGESKEFDITFPQDYHAADMRGKKVRFRLKLTRLEEKLTQKLDETLVTKIAGQKESVADFKKRVEADLLMEMETRASQEHDNKVVSEIIKMTVVELPQALIDEEVKYMLEEKKTQVTRQGLTWEQYLQHIKKTEEDFAKDHAKAAEERLKARLGVQHIIRDANISASDEEVEAKIQELVAHYPKEQQGQARQHYVKDSEGYRNLKGNLAADKLINMLSK